LKKQFPVSCIFVGGSHKTKPREEVTGFFTGFCIKKEEENEKVIFRLWL